MIVVDSPAVSVSCCRYIDAIGREVEYLVVGNGIVAVWSAGGTIAVNSIGMDTGYIRTVTDDTIRDGIITVTHSSCRCKELDSTGCCRCCGRVPGFYLQETQGIEGSIIHEPEGRRERGRCAHIPDGPLTGGATYRAAVETKVIHSVQNYQGCIGGRITGRQPGGYPCSRSDGNIPVSANSAKGRERKRKGL